MYIKGFKMSDNQISSTQVILRDLTTSHWISLGNFWAYVQSRHRFGSDLNLYTSGRLLQWEHFTGVDGETGLGYSENPGPAPVHVVKGEQNLPCGHFPVPLPGLSLSCLLSVGPLVLTLWCIWPRCRLGIALVQSTVLFAHWSFVGPSPRNVLVF